MLNCVQIFIIILSFSLYWFKNKQKFKFISPYILYYFIKLIQYSCILYYLDLNASITGKNYFIIFVVRKIAIRKFEEREIVLNVCTTRVQLINDDLSCKRMVILAPIVPTVERWESICAEDRRTGRDWSRDTCLAKRNLSDKI